MAFDRNLLDGMAHGVLIVSSNFEICAWNRVLEGWTGIDAESAVGNLIDDFLPELGQPLYRDRLELVLEKGLPAVFSPLLHETLLPAIGNEGHRPVYAVTVSRVMHEGRPHALFSVQDVRESVEQTKKYQRLHRDATIAVRAKSDFVASISHEIRTPLNGVLGFCDLLNESELDALQKEFAESIRVSGSHLLDLMNDILDFSQLEAGEVRLDKVPADVVSIAKAVMEIHRSEAKRKRLGFTANFTGAIRGLWRIDERRLKQILINLVDNAVKFTDFGSVELRIERLDDGLAFAVVDTGIGIANSEQARLFQPFVQVESGATRMHDGSGLGLSIVQKLVHLMNGELTVDSVVGEGSMFRFTIDAEQVKLEDYRDGRAEERELEGRFLEGVSVLLVEDNPVNTALARRVLEHTGAKVVAVVDGAQAVEQACAADFDVILMDCHMPVMDGWEATQRLREGEVKTPIIALTADAMEGDRGRCLTAGMNDYLSKPFRPNDLRRLVRHWADRGANETPLLVSPEDSR
jgi:signal transduction histidine kinase/ActR/RegA family two-component response regulator